MTGTPAWLADYPSCILTAETWRFENALSAAIFEIQRLNDRIAVLESGQREMETRLPTEGGS